MLKSIELLDQTINKVKRASKLYLTVKCGSPFDFIPVSKLPKNKVVLQRYLSLKNEIYKEKIDILVNILHAEATGIWMSTRRKINSLIPKFNAFKHKNPKETPEKQVTEFLNQLNFLGGGWLWMGFWFSSFSLFSGRIMLLGYSCFFCF